MIWLYLNLAGLIANAAMFAVMLQPISIVGMAASCVGLAMVLA